MIVSEVCVCCLYVVSSPIYVLSPSLMEVVQIPCCLLICWGLVPNVVDESSEDTFREVNVSGKICHFFWIPVPVECNHSLLFEVLDGFFEGKDDVLVGC